MFESNQHLVLTWARRYEGQVLPLPDLVEAGNRGLRNAVEQYDERHGFTFPTYATWWIHQAITRALAERAGG